MIGHAIRQVTLYCGPKKTMIRHFFFRLVYNAVDAGCLVAMKLKQMILTKQKTRRITSGPRLDLKEWQTMETSVT